jgi:hypothetical protein
MRQFTISAAAATVFAALLASAPAQAENLNGQPDRVGNQCFTYAQGAGRDARWGTWGACPQTASAAVAPAPAARQVRRHHRSSR